MLDPRASQFWQAAIRSGLMDVESLTACWDAIEPAKRDDPEHIDRRLARQAVQSKLLTFWQAQQLLAGRTTGYKVDRYRAPGPDRPGRHGAGLSGTRHTAQPARGAQDPLARAAEAIRERSARFQREARVGAQLQHENLVRIYDFGESNGRYFLVMEYIEGKTIATLISEQGPMPPATAVRLVRQVALGLEHAHRKGLIHRDVNPYNILVTHDGTAKLADLGLAIALAEEDRVTRDGATVGTFDYVAPEQARHSRAADIRSDIYSLGCTIYHMCTGQVPFPGPSLPEKLFGHQSIEPTPLSRMVPGLPEGLSEIVQRMMKKSPDGAVRHADRSCQALSPYRGDSTRFGDREGKPPIRVPLVVGTARPSIDAAGPHESGGVAASVEAVPATAGPNASSEVAAKRKTRPFAATPAVPLLTPDDDLDWAADEIRLIPDPDPEPSSCGGRPQPGTRSSADDWLSTAFAVSVLRWLTPARRWGLVALATMVAVFILILAMAR